VAEIKYPLMIYSDFLQVNKRLGKPFVLNWWGQDTLFMPAAFLEDLRKADFESLSFFQSLSDVRRTDPKTTSICSPQLNRLSISVRRSATSTAQTR
jgi:hypothetical protein